MTLAPLAVLLSLALAACGDGTLPAHSAADPRDPRAVETPFSAAPGEPRAPPSPSEAPPPGGPDAGHQHVREGATGGADFFGTRTVEPATSDARRS